ncbi:MAG: biotin/lipoyl-binding protein [Magnetococcales bacterium]|nr:biotin/lipoyl-binding protein [Magnetococcales bacterium]
MTGLPPLREELQLFPGPRARDHSPTWTLHDPASNRFFTLGWREFEILSRWTAGRPDQVAERTRRETPLGVDVGHVQDLARFLTLHNLVRANGPQELQRLARQAAARQEGWARRLLHTYLFFRVPLVRPDRFLSWLLPGVAWLFTGPFWFFMAGTGLLALWLAGRQWETFLHTLPELFSPGGLLLFVLAMTLSKTAHELGHALAARRHGCRVPTMGVAFLVMWPVLYTDVTEVWKLPRWRQRLAVGGAGVLAELALAVLATLAWSFLPDGPARSGAFYLATTSWIMTLGINLSPFLRFDGYYLLSDWLEIPNLHDRAGVLGRWWLRERLLGLGDPDPEPTLRGRRGGLVLFALLTWIYRLVLFLGIALLVYHFFFKVLGLFLMMVEVGWFIVRPVTRELGLWWQWRGRLRLNANLVVTLLLAGLGGFLLLHPWQTLLRAPALLRPLPLPTLFSPAPARLEEWLVAPGDRVRAGQPLARLQAPELTHRLDQATREIRLLGHQLALETMDPLLLERQRETRLQLETRLAEQRGLLPQQAQLTLMAPGNGEVVQRLEHLRPGDWVSPREPLLELADDSRWSLEAYATEHQRDRILFGGRCLFLPEMGDQEPIEARVVAIETANIEQLRESWLTTDFGGEIPAYNAPRGERIPRRAFYRVLLEPTNPPRAGLVRIFRGSVQLPGLPQSLWETFLDSARGVLVRESGF